ncbi:hypothetical protein F4678DRAFT_425076 [Xylaria arbuscula]|nr:hypothetical protein F4678DRAFT_425076 [Xylaria arbuscula]
MSALKFSSCGRYVKGYDHSSAGFSGSVTLIGLREIIEAAEGESAESINSQV